MNLRPRRKQPFSGFTKAEVQKMERLFKESKQQSLGMGMDFFKDLAKVFNRSSNRAGKPILKWAQIQNWFQTKQESRISEETSFDEDSSEETSLDEAKNVIPDFLNQSKATENRNIPEGPKSKDSPTMEFEAKSSTDGAWYDVDQFLAHRFLSSGEIEAHVQFVGFGPEYNEWVNVKNDVRERSFALEHSECDKLKVGDSVVCFQERRDEAKYYDAQVLDIQRRMHDVRGCRCLFLIKYNHDSSQEKVRLKRLCCRPSLVARMENREIE